MTLRRNNTATSLRRARWGLLALAMAAPAVGWSQFSGPSSVPVTTVQQLLKTGRDDQHATLRGRIVSHDGGDRYTFSDASGRMPVEIDSEHFPAGVKIDDKVMVEISGEFEKSRTGRAEFDVDRIAVLPR